MWLIENHVWEYFLGLGLGFIYTTSQPPGNQTYCLDQGGADGVPVGLPRQTSRRAQDVDGFDWIMQTEPG